MIKLVRSLSLAAVASSLLLLAGCNTVEGIGKDVQSVGKETEEAARAAK